MYISQRVAQTSTVRIASHGVKKREGYARIDSASGDASQMVTPKQDLVGVRCNHTTTNLLRASNMAKPRTREANTSIKHRSKQAYTCKIGMIQTL